MLHLDADKKVSVIKMQTQYWNLNDDSLNFNMHFSLPLNQFVFKKNVDHFLSEITLTLVISDIDNNLQLTRQSWKENISEYYYENTRNKDSYYKTEDSVHIIYNSNHL